MWTLCVLTVELIHFSFPDINVSHTRKLTEPLGSCHYVGIVDQITGHVMTLNYELQEVGLVSLSSNSRPSNHKVGISSMTSPHLETISEFAGISSLA